MFAHRSKCGEVIRYTRDEHRHGSNIARVRLASSCIQANFREHRSRYTGIFYTDWMCDETEQLWWRMPRLMIVLLKQMHDALRQRTVIWMARYAFMVEGQYLVIVK
jgi:hypothetical protein